MMINDFHYDARMLETAIGGRSVIDIPRLNIQTEKDAFQFLETYGFDLKIEEDLEQVWNYQRRAVGFIKDHLLREGEELPEELTDPKKLQCPSRLLTYAGSLEAQAGALQRAACSILRVMHVLVHLDNDLFRSHSDEIQKQIFKPFQDRLSKTSLATDALGLQSDGGQIPLKKFEIKPFKTTTSAVIKLLAKPETVVQRVFDRLGVRFVTRDICDSFRVLRYLVDHHVVSVPHIISDQSNNTLFPTNIFLATMNELAGKNEALDSEKVQESLLKKMEASFDQARFHEKENLFSGENYRFIKFIGRKLVSVPVINALGDEEKFRFFYPFEVQIMDYESYVDSLKGDSAHDKYKERQKRAARVRVFGFHLFEEEPPCPKSK